MKKITSALISVLLAVTAFAEDTIPNPSITEGTVTIDGKAIAYVAETGYMKLQDEDLKHTANVFYVSYRKKNTTESTRPITFCFNGGPGSSSIWLHLGALGPKRLEMTAEGNATPPPYKMVDNNYSWLDLTDLVFIDPVGTGFSRPAEGEKADQFYGYSNDIKSVSEFIRLFLNKEKRWQSPKYLAGESYGTTRAVGVSKYLAEEHGIYVNGISLISAALDFSTLREYDGNDLATICYLPVYASTAHYHNTIDTVGLPLAECIENAERFAMGPYMQALSKGRQLDSTEIRATADSLARYTGLSPAFIMKNHLRVPSYRFRKALLNDQWKNVGRYDSRLTIADTDPANDYGVDDASYVHIKGAFSTCMNSYVRNQLQYKNDLPYKIIGSVRPWQFANGKYLNVIPALERSLMQNPNMKVWVANGYYDMATSYFGTEYALAHLFVPEALYQNVSMTYYHGGHMMYLIQSELKKLKADAVTFFQ